MTREEYVRWCVDKCRSIAVEDLGGGPLRYELAAALEEGGYSRFLDSVGDSSDELLGWLDQLGREVDELLGALDADFRREQVLRA